MKPDEKIGSYGMISIIITLVCTKALISAPVLYVKHSASAGWLEVLISGLFEILILSIVLKLLLKFENMDLIDLSDFAFGKVGKIIVGIGSTAVFTVCSAAVFRCFGELVRNTVIRGISYKTVALCLFVPAIISAFLGFKTQLSLNGLIVPVLIVTIGIIVLISFSRYSVDNILPVAGPGITSVMKNALLKNASYFEVGVILFLVPYLGGEKTVKKISFTALIASISLLSGITLFYQLSVPYKAASTFAVPLYQMTRMIKAGTFFQRIEPLNLFIWGGAMFMYVGVGIWLSSHVFSKTFSLATNKPMILIFGIITCILGLLPGSETSVEEIYDFLLNYTYIAYPLAPLLILIIAVACKSKRKEEKA